MHAGGIIEWRVKTSVTRARDTGESERGRGGPAIDPVNQLTRDDIDGSVAFTLHTVTRSLVLQCTLTAKVALVSKCRYCPTNMDAPS